MIEYKEIAINKNMSFGQRCLYRTPLTEDEIKWLKDEIRPIGADESKFVFNDEEHIHKSA